MKFEFDYFVTANPFKSQTSNKTIRIWTQQKNLNNNKKIIAIRCGLCEFVERAMSIYIVSRESRECNVFFRVLVVNIVARPVFTFQSLDVNWAKSFVGIPFISSLVCQKMSCGRRRMCVWARFLSISRERTTLLDFRTWVSEWRWRERHTLKPNNVRNATLIRQRCGGNTQPKYARSVMWNASYMSKNVWQSHRNLSHSIRFVPSPSGGEQ